MQLLGVLCLSTFLFADVIDDFRRIGLIVVPIAAFLIVLGILYLKGRFRGAHESGKRIGEELQGKAAYPIASCCPEWGCTEYSNAKDQEGAYIVLYDRICTRCGVRYTPPIPRWLCVTLVPLGVVIAAAGVGSWFLFQEMELGSMGNVIPVLIVVAGVAFSAIGIGKLRVQSARSSDRDDEPSG